jgi:hypothetical protein
MAFSKKPQGSGPRAGRSTDSPSSGAGGHRVGSATRARGRGATVAPQPATSQIGVRISAQERLLLDRLIVAAERKSSMAPGTITPASYARSALLAYMAQGLAELEAGRGEADTRGPEWERLQENVALLGEASRPPSRPKR